jgi:hypothetical protein
VEPDDEPGAEIAAAGVIRITPFLFLRQLLTFRASGRRRRDPIAASKLIGRFFAFFVGTMARLYLRR